MNKLSMVMAAFALTVVTVSAQTFRVDSVTVDSVWNSDTTIAGFPLTRRDLRVSFVPVAADSVVCFVDMSLDSGRTWICDRDILDVIGNTGSFRAAPNRRNSVTMRARSGDTTGVVLRVTARKDTATIGGCRITDQVPGWSEDTSKYGYFRDTPGLASLIDGGFMDYTQRGLIDGFRQTLTTPDSLHLCSIMSMDFGTLDRAASMFAFRIASIQRPVYIQGHDSTVALARPILGGYAVAAHFKHFYHEFSITGYTTNGSDSVTAKADAAAILNFYEQKATHP